MPNIITNSTALSPTGAKIYGQSAAGVAGWLDGDILSPVVVPVVGVSASADTAAINAALLNGNKKVVINGTATVDGQLVLYSNTELELTPGSVLKYDDSVASVAVPMIVNHASLAAQRSISYSGTIVGGATTVTDSSITSADIGRSIYIPLARSTEGVEPEKFLFCTTILSVEGTTATLAKPTLIDTVNPVISIYDRDENIKISGGTIDRNVAAGSTSIGSMLMFFRHVDGLEISDQSIFTASTNTKYAISIGDATKVSCINVTFNTCSDGLHFMGECYDITVRDIYGTTGDDFVAFTALDYSTYADTVGDIDNVTIENLFPNQTSMARTVLLLGGASCILSDFNVTGIKGVAATSLSIIDDPLNGSSKTLVKNIRASKIQIAGAIQLFSTNPRSTVFIDGVDILKQTAMSIYIQGSYDVLSIAGIHIDKHLAVDTSDQIIKITSPARIGTLRIANVDINLGDAYRFGKFLTNEGVISSLIVDGFRFYKPTYTTGYNDMFLNYGTISRVALSTIVFVNGHNLFNTIVGSTTGKILLFNFFFSGCARISDFTAASEVILGVGLTESMLAQEFYISNAAGSLILRGGGQSLSATPTARSASQSIRIDNPDIRSDISMLTPSNGDRAWNTNAALGTLGVAGPVIYSTGTGWHLIADPTKVYVP